MVLGTAAVEGVECAFAGSKKVGGSRTDASAAVEGDAKVAVMVGDSDGGAAKEPGGVGVGSGGAKNSAKNQHCIGKL